MLFLALILVSAIIAGSAQSCSEHRSYIADPEQCDRYTVCFNGAPYPQLCPDGLVFNERMPYPGYPCSFMNEVDCGSRTELQPAQPGPNCPRAFGHYGSGDPAVCGFFYNCAGGRSFKIQCSEGLAFSSLTYTCDWPEKSPDCDAHAFYGFTCPANENRFRILREGYAKYASPKDCRKFFLCEGNVARIQVCGSGLVFNDAIGDCDEPEKVEGCKDYYSPTELTRIRTQKVNRRKALETKRKLQKERIANRKKNPQPPKTSSSSASSSNRFNSFSIFANPFVQAPPRGLHTVPSPSNQPTAPPKKKYISKRKQAERPSTNPSD